jgi:uncharacterized membrane protein
MMMDGMGFGGMWFGPVIWIFLIGVIIWGFFTIVNRNSGHQYRAAELPEDVALEVLKKRYASGEITEEQFKIIRNNLLS